EALAQNLANRWPAGAIVSSEAGVVFGGHGMQRESIMRNLALLNSLWDGATISVDRRQSGHFQLSGARFSVGLAAQPETVRTFLDNSKGLARGTGFAARFLIGWPQSTQGSRLFQSPGSWASVGKFNGRIRQLLHIEPIKNVDGSLNPPALQFSRAAQDEWVRFHNDTERELRAGGDMIEVRDVASKAADNVARMAALFHIYESGPSGLIEEKHVRAAGAVVGWHLYEARRFL